MHADVDDHLIKLAPRSTKTVVSPQEYTITGNMDYNELESLIRAANQYNARVSLESGALKVRLGRG